MAVVELDGKGRARENLFDTTEHLERRFLCVLGSVGFGGARTGPAVSSARSYSGYSCYLRQLLSPNTPACRGPSAFWGLGFGGGANDLAIGTDLSAAQFYRPTRKIARLRVAESFSQIAWTRNPKGPPGRVLAARAPGSRWSSGDSMELASEGFGARPGQAAELFAIFDGYQYIVADAPLPVALLDIKADASGSGLSERSEPIYGGYAKGRGEIVLFGKDLAYRVDFKNQTLQQRPQLNSGAQARYDATEAGEPFEYCNKTFRRLSGEQIVEICASGRFRVTSRQI
jgi:hypothetical protein